MNPSSYIWHPMWGVDPHRPEKPYKKILNAQKWSQEQLPSLCFSCRPWYRDDVAFELSLSTVWRIPAAV